MSSKRDPSLRVGALAQIMFPWGRTRFGRVEALRGRRLRLRLLPDGVAQGGVVRLLRHKRGTEWEGADGGAGGTLERVGFSPPTPSSPEGALRRFAELAHPASFGGRHRRIVRARPPVYGQGRPFVGDDGHRDELLLALGARTRREVPTS